MKRWGSSGRRSLIRRQRVLHPSSRRQLDGSPSALFIARPTRLLARVSSVLVIEVHKYVGFFVVALFTVGWVWGLIAWIAKRDPGGAVLGLGDGGRRSWPALQALIGIVVFLLGNRASTILHYAYGIFPILALGIAHVVARTSRFPRTAVGPVRVGGVHLLRAHAPRRHDRPRRLSGVPSQATLRDCRTH